MISPPFRHLSGTRSAASSRITRFPPAGSSLGSKYLIDNNIPTPTNGRSITTTNVADYDDNQYLAKVDHQFGTKLRLSGHAFWSRAHAPGNLTPTNYFEETDIRTGAIPAMWETLTGLSRRTS